MLLTKKGNGKIYRKDMSWQSGIFWIEAPHIGGKKMKNVFKILPNPTIPSFLKIQSLEAFL